jgi:NaMN:DMB phosphoribosyltransferase
MSGDIIAASPARRRGARVQLAGMAGAVAAAVAVSRDTLLHVIPATRPSVPHERPSR